ncbi:MAG: tRNA epoxyqueuosine(34) reductase QueG [Neomegalonema sp.]|nr:tRNA epoxyqueuosine(34) reductase QueG [Neomegalonema sp.]
MPHNARPNDDLAERVKRRAREEGFADVGITTPDAIAAAGRHLHAFIDAGHHGQMIWMEDRLAWRSNPRALWPQARSILMLTEAYTPAHDPRAILQERELGAISVYAQNRDYHDIAKKRLKRLGRWLVEQTGCEIKVFVDTAPVMEKPLAQAAGLGWQGKHTNLVSRAEGSWFFLGAIFSTLELPPDPPHPDHCGACRRCLDICPTAAFPAPHQLDARRCISYLTIEHKGLIPRAFRPLIGNRIYGCDDCLAVCPWNKFARTARETGYWARAELQAPLLGDLAALDDPGFREVFSGSPIKRIGRDRLIRNVLIAIGNSGSADLARAASALLADPAEEVRGTAVWALSRLIGREALARLRDPDERAPAVIAEWQAALLPENELLELDARHLASGSSRIER